MEIGPFEIEQPYDTKWMSWSGSRRHLVTNDDICRQVAKKAYLKWRMQELMQDQQLIREYCYAA